MLIKDKGITPGDISAYKVILTTLDGVEKNITQASLKVDLYQDILMPYWSGTLHIGDTSNMITTLPIGEGCQLKITWGTKFEFPEKFKSETERTIEVICYAIENRELHNGHLMTYQLLFASEEFLRDKKIRISGRYPQMQVNQKKPKAEPPGKLIKKFIEEKLPGRTVDIKTDSQIPNSIDAANWSLFYTTSFLSKISVEDKEADFMLVKTDEKSYIFERLSNLYSKDEYSVGIDLYRKPANTANKPDFNDMQTIIEMKINHYNASMNMDAGYEGNKIFHFDFTTKQAGFTSKTNKDKDKKKSDAIIEKGGAGTTDFDPTTNNANIYFQPRSSTEIGVADISKSQNYWLGDRRQSLLRLEQDTFTVQLHGQVAAVKWLGKNIEVKVPAFQDHMPGHEKDVYDKAYTGRYLITAIHHEISVMRYSINMKLANWTTKGGNPSTTSSTRPQRGTR